MAKCPFAVQKLLPENRTQGRITPRAVICHQAVSSAASLYDFFKGSSDLESHFYVNKEGTLEQYMDTLVRADANYLANDFAISIETWDNAGRATKWNQKQLNMIIRLIDWLCKVHPGIRRDQITRWNGSGIGWHVQFGAPGPWTPSAKTCPGAGRIEQIKKIIIPTIKGQDMPLTNKEMNEIAERVWAHKIKNKITGNMVPARVYLGFNVHWMDNRVRRALQDILDIDTLAEVLVEKLGSLDHTLDVAAAREAFEEVLTNITVEDVDEQED